MNKKYLSILSIFTIVLSLAIFSSCSDDEDDGETSSLSITSIDPSTARVGESITIKGAGFDATPSRNTVNFTGPGAVGIVTEATATQLKVTVREGAQTGPITVVANGKTVTSSQVFTLDTSTAAPTLQSISLGSARPGTEITITGTNFSANADDMHVFFGDTEATQVNASTTTEIDVIVPALDEYSEESLSVTVRRGEVVSSNNLEFIVLAPLPRLASIYWTGNGTGVNRTDATGTTNIYGTDAFLLGIAVDNASGDLYYIDVANIQILKGKLDGSGEPQVLYDAGDGLTYPADIALDTETGSLYFTDLMNNKIYKGALDGSTAPQELYDLASGGGSPYNVKLYVDGGDLYWTESVGIRVAHGKTDGSGTAETLFDAADGLHGPFSIAIDAENDKIYLVDAIVDESTGAYISTIYTGKLDGTGSLTALFEAGDGISGYVNDIEIDPVNGYIYWLNQEGIDGEIMRGDLEGNASEVVFEHLNDGLFFDIVYE